MSKRSNTGYPVTSSDIATLHRPTYCQWRVHLAANHPELKSPPDELGRLLQRWGREHERGHLQTLPPLESPKYRWGDVEAGARATREILARKPTGIYQAVFLSADGRLSGRPDFLLRDGANWVIRDAKWLRRLDGRPDVIAQMAVYHRLAGEVLGGSVRCEVLLRDGTIEPVAPVDVESLIELVARLKRGEGPIDGTVGWSKCEACPFFDHCWSEAEKANDLGLVVGIDRSLVRTLHQAGVFRCDDLAGWTPEQLTAAVHVRTGSRLTPRRAQAILRQARVLVTGQCELIRKPAIPPASSLGYLDVETDPFAPRGRVHLWGLATETRDVLSYHGEIAEPADDERAWVRFLRACESYLESTEDARFCHYSPYEPRWINTYLGRHGDVDGIAAAVLSRLWDLAKCVRDSVCLPVYSYGLKQVEAWAGCRRRLPEASASWSVARYHAWLESQDDAQRTAISREVLAYNEDDLRAMQWVVERMRTLCEGA